MNNNFEKTDISVICPICFHMMEDPETLPRCLHSFCRRCLLSQTRCPFCRKDLNFVSMLPTSRFFQGRSLNSEETFEIYRIKPQYHAVNWISFCVRIRNKGSEIIEGYDALGQPIYTGEHHSNVPHGFGTKFHKNKQNKKELAVEYRGHWKNGKKEGHGELFSSEGELLYIGDFQNNKQHGLGKNYDYEGALKYDGEWVENRAEGFGKLYWSCGAQCLRYEGLWKKGTFCGFGKSYRPNGNLEYKGTWVNNLPDGYGEMYSFQGDLIYEGSWVKGCWSGYGKCYLGVIREGTHRSILIYEGETANSMRHGYGRLYDLQERIEYEGDFVMDLKQGEGTEYDLEGKVVYHGQFTQNHRHGMGRQYQDGFIIYNGPWQLGFRENTKPRLHCYSSKLTIRDISLSTSINSIDLSLIQKSIEESQKLDKFDRSKIECN